MPYLTIVFLERKEREIMITWCHTSLMIPCYDLPVPNMHVWCKSSIVRRSPLSTVWIQTPYDVIKMFTPISAYSFSRKICHSLNTPRASLLPQGTTRNTPNPQCSQLLGFTQIMSSEQGTPPSSQQFHPPRLPSPHPSYKLFSFLKRRTQMSFLCCFNRW